MSFDKTLYKNSFTKSHQFNFFKKRLIVENPFQKLVPTFSLSNYTTKNKKAPLFLRTSNLYFGNSSINNNSTNKSNYTQIKYIKRINPKQRPIQIKKIKIKKSLSEIFQNNDIDLVRNLNIDSLAQFNNNLRLKENLINLSRDYFEESKDKKINNLIFDNNKDSKREFEEIKNKKEILPILNRNTINKSYELLQAKNKELNLELNDNAEKEVMNKIKILRKEMNIKINKKKEKFERIKELEEEMREIDEENQFMKDLYLKVINDISNDKDIGIDIFEEVIKFKIKSKFYSKKNNNIKSRKSFLEVLNLKKIKNKSGNSEESSIENDPQEELNPKNQGNKRLEIFEKNLKKTNKKKKYDNFRKEQEEKMNELIEEKKKYEKEINLIEIDIDKLKKEEKVIIDKLMMSYKETLFKGKNVKNEGLVWIVKAIWNLGENVPMSFMPDFLDCESIDYLFKLARKQNSMESLTKKILEIKVKLKKKISNKSTHFIKSPKNNENKSDEIISNSKTLSVKAKLILKMEKETKISENEKKRKDIYKDLVNQFKGNAIKFEIINMPEINMINKLEKQIEKIKEEISELKNNEINRIIKCFIEKNYENIFHTNIETVLAALVGLDEKEAIVNKYNITKKNYLMSIKQIRFYDHKYASKKISS